MGVPTGEVHATRRGGARLEVSARVTLTPVPASAPAAATPGKVLQGWALNVGRGGVRVILEEKVEPGSLFEVELQGGVGAADAPQVDGAPHQGRVVWIQEEPDGVVAGIEFTSEPAKP
jgi:hypothetical protein